MAVSDDYNERAIGSNETERFVSQSAQAIDDALRFLEIGGSSDEALRIVSSIGEIEQSVVAAPF
jgi:hypothetical protein